MDAVSDTQKFIIRDPSCDRATISMIVAEWPWENNQILSELDNNSSVFFLQEGLDESQKFISGMVFLEDDLLMDN